MLIYKDKISGDELFSDAFPVEEFMCFYKVTGKRVTRQSGGIDESLIGGNKSAEDDCEDTEESAAETGINIVFNHQLQEAPPFDKKTFMNYMKPYMKCVKEKMNMDCEKQIKDFQSAMQEGVKYLIKNLKNLEFFVGESQNPDGSMGYLDYEEDGCTPYMLFFKDAIEVEKV